MLFYFVLLVFVGGVVFFHFVLQLDFSVSFANGMDLLLCISHCCSAHI